MARALLLDRNYMALTVITWKKAIGLLVKGKAEPVGDSASVQIPTISGEFKVPSILRLMTVIPWRAHQGRMKFSAKNVYIRDDYKCQYCSKRLGKNGATIDHIIPRSRGGATNYKNCVACCKACNNKKGNKKPAEAGMILLKEPKKPTFLTLYRYHMKNPPTEWNDYVIGL